LGFVGNEETRLGKNRVSGSTVKKAGWEKTGFLALRNPVGKKPGFWFHLSRNPVGKKPGFWSHCQETWLGKNRVSGSTVKKPGWEKTGFLVPLIKGTLPHE